MSFWPWQHRKCQFQLGSHILSQMEIMVSYPSYFSTLLFSYFIAVAMPGRRGRVLKDLNFHPDIRWISLYIVRIVCNYDNPENTLTEASQILRHASEGKENSLCQLSPVMLGKIVNEIWGEKVKLVRRGPRNERKSFTRTLWRKKT